MFRYIWFVVLLGISFSTHARVNIILDPAQQTAEQDIRAALLQSEVTITLETFINEIFIIPTPITIQFGNNDGPYYENNYIAIPYTLLDEIEVRFTHTLYNFNRETAEDAMLDNVMHTLFHELAHALIHQYQLPILGKEEDSADSFANFLLLAYFEDGARIAHSAAELFHLEGKGVLRFMKQDFWGEHSLDTQRYYTTMCHIYGSNPKKHVAIKEQAQFSDERALRCIEEYELLSQSWLTVLRPHMHSNN